MARYDRILLNALMDSYEKSLLFTGENKVNIKISFPFTKKSIPAYFEESSLTYEDIHACVQELAHKSFIIIEWKKKKENHIISRIILNTEKNQEIYEYLHRKPRLQLLEQNLQLLEQRSREYQTPVCGRLISYLQQRLQENKSVKEYIELTDLKGTDRLLHCIYLIEINSSACYIREFSIRHFSDSKAFEEMEGTVTKIMRRFGTGDQDRELLEILSEYGIYHTPDYVYFKGNVTLTANGREMDIGVFHQGIGISGEDIPGIQFQGLEKINRVITIENLTSFFRFQKKDALVLYLGGYHNAVRRSLLQKLYKQLPSASYYHFGDIDAGGFEIFEDLCSKTGIPFALYKMDADILKQYRQYGKPLTENDKKRIIHMLEAKKPAYEPVLRYMLSENLKLEQECIREMD